MPAPRPHIPMPVPDGSEHALYLRLFVTNGGGWIVPSR